MKTQTAFVTFALLWLVGCSSQSAKQCSPGEQGCACVADSCNGGLVCAGGSCTPEARAGLTVGSVEARSCEVLLADTTGKVDQVQFGDDITGRWLRQGDKVAAAFVANRDSPIGSSAVQVTYASGGTFSVVGSHCYGSHGEALPGATVHQ